MPKEIMAIMRPISLSSRPSVTLPKGTTLVQVRAAKKKIPAPVAAAALAGTSQRKDWRRHGGGTGCPMGEAAQYAWKQNE